MVSHRLLLRIAIGVCCIQHGFGSREAADLTDAELVEKKEIKDSMVELLDALPQGSKVAVASMNSLAPPTLAHVYAFMEAKKIFTSEPGMPFHPAKLEVFKAMLGFMAVEANDEARKMVDLTFEPYDWISSEATAGDTTINALGARWPQLHFEKFVVKGAESMMLPQEGDVQTRDAVSGPQYLQCAQQTGPRKLIFQRAGILLKEKMAAARIDPEGAQCILGPELLDAELDQNKARKLAQEGNLPELLQLVHPEVADMLLKQHGHSHKFAPGRKFLITFPGSKQELPVKVMLMTHPAVPSPAPTPKQDILPPPKTGTSQKSGASSQGSAQWFGVLCLSAVLYTTRALVA